MLYYRGNANLNQSKIVAIVGTRNHNEYGKAVCEKLVEDLAGKNILIISGLAFGYFLTTNKRKLNHLLRNNSYANY